MFAERVLHPRCPPPRKAAGEENGPGAFTFSAVTPPACISHKPEVPPFLLPGEPALPQSPSWQQATSWLMPTGACTSITRSQACFNLFSMYMRCRGLSVKDNHRGILCSTTTREVVSFFVQEGTNQGSWLRLTGLMRALAGGGRPVTSTGKGH